MFREEIGVVEVTLLRPNRSPTVSWSNTTTSTGRRTTKGNTKDLMKTMAGPTRVISTVRVHPRCAPHDGRRVDPRLRRRRRDRWRAAWARRAAVRHPADPRQRADGLRPAGPDFFLGHVAKVGSTKVPTWVVSLGPRRRSICSGAPCWACSC